MLPDVAFTEVVVVVDVGRLVVDVVAKWRAVDALRCALVQPPASPAQVNAARISVHLAVDTANSLSPASDGSSSDVSATGAGPSSLLEVAAIGRVPKTPPVSGTASTLPSQYPIANVKGTIGATGFTLNMVLTLPTSLASSKLQSFGHVTGTFRNQQVAATLTANVNSCSFTFVGTIGSLHIAATYRSKSSTETARATFNMTK
jgi:hypothetical protein